MSFDLIRYSEYQASGWQWLGEVPAHWKIAPGFAVFREKKVSNFGMQETQVLSLSYGKIIVKPPEKLHGLVPASFETYQIVDPGDIIIRCTDLQNDWNSLRVGLVRDRGIITSAYLCLHVLPGMTPEFAYLLLHTYDLKKFFYGMGSGLRQNLDFTDFKRMTVFIPPLEEQAQIVRFVENLEHRVNHYIRAKRRQIELLNEQKQAIIQQAVTRGLDPNVRMKPSGVEWLGDVPEHWKITRLKFITSHIVDCLHATPEYIADGSYPAIRTSDIDPGTLYLEKARRISKEQYDLWTSRLRPRPGDILYSREGDFGIAALVPEGVELCISQRMMIFRLKPENFSKYIMWQLNCTHVYSQAAADVIGATAPHVNIERIRNYDLVLPPLSEQVQIVKWIKVRISKIEIEIVKLRNQIMKIREYQTRIISDITIGRMDIQDNATIPDINDLTFETEDFIRIALEDFVEDDENVELEEE